MAVKASASISIWDVVDITGVTWYYKLQSSTAATPSKPTTATPSGWTTTEPTYTAGSTNTLYITCKVLFSDGTFAYSDVSKSSSYEAAKAAYNKAQNADNKVNSQMKYFWKDEEGIHVATDQECAGNNVLITDSDIQVRYGSTTLATFSKNIINLGDITDSEEEFGESIINLCGGAGIIRALFEWGVIKSLYLDSPGQLTLNSQNSAVDIQAKESIGLYSSAGNVNLEGEAVTINGKLISDHVVEQGTSGIWTYRKWASGIAECWCNYALTVKYIYGNYVNGSIAWPFTFVGQEPNANVTFGVEDTVSSYLAYCGTSTTQINVYGYVPSNMAGTKCWFHITAIGRWK